MKLRRPLLRAVLAVVCAVPVAAQVGPNWTPKGNLEDCSLAAQRGIKSVDRKVWGEIHFSCYEDGLVQIFASPTTRIALTPASFVHAYPGIFGLTKGIEVDDNLKQRFHGLPVVLPRWDIIFEQGLDMYSDKGRFLIEGHFHETTHWVFAPPTISSDAAKARALRYWGSENFKPDSVDVQGPFEMSVSSAPIFGEPFVGWWLKAYGAKRGFEFDVMNGRTGDVTRILGPGEPVP